MDELERKIVAMLNSGVTYVAPCGTAPGDDGEPIEHPGEYIIDGVVNLREIIEAIFEAGAESVRASMSEEDQEPMTYIHPTTGERITSARFRRYVTDWVEVEPQVRVAR